MNNRLCIFGEVLFDHFPDGHKVMGGAPFNVAWHLTAFGLQPLFISRIGDDTDGKDIIAAMQDWRMDTSHLQIDPALPTGRVDIQIIDNEPEYDIVAPSAWDRIAPPTSMATPFPAYDLLYHGSLALRDPVSLETLITLKQQGNGMVFVDINLRPPWCHAETIATALQHADWVKLNEHELDQLASDGDVRADEGRDEKCTRFMATHDLTGLVVTLGAAGAELYTADDRYSITPDTDTAIVDTVGAGDAFCSVILLGIVSDWPYQTTLQRAQQFASAVVAQRGATISDPDYYQQLTSSW